MKLNDAKKIAIRKQARIRFALSNGMECVVDEHGIGRTPGLNRAPDFNLEEEFGRAEAFTIETASSAAKRPAARRISRTELEALAAEKAAAADHDD